uniref:hypothetical protein n=1 Tax=Pseudomonas syringae TaxID=317 RepID=UPI000E32CBC8
HPVSDNIIRKDELKESRDFMNGFLGFGGCGYRILLLGYSDIDVRAWGAFERILRDDFPKFRHERLLG